MKWPSSQAVGAYVVAVLPLLLGSAIDASPDSILMAYSVLILVEALLISAKVKGETKVIVRVIHMEGTTAIAAEGDVHYEFTNASLKPEPEPEPDPTPPEKAT